MKGFVFGLLFVFSTSSFAATHPASTWVNTTLVKAMKILELKDDNAKVSQMCSIFKARMALSSISNQWLGRYAGISTDQDGVKAFRKIMPSLLVTQFSPILGNFEGGVFHVGPNPRPVGSGRFEVDVTVDADKTYNVKALVAQTKSAFVLYDVKAYGMSAVGHMAKEYKKRFDEEMKYNPTRPVSNVVDQIKNSVDYVNCP